MTFFHDQQRNLLIYDRLSPLVLGHLPEAIALNGSYVAVPRTLRNSRILRHFSYPVAPVMEQYDWPASPEITPWHHQILAANFAVLHPRSFNLSDLGSGKTLSLLWATDFIMRQYPKGQCRCLIVAPLSTLQSVWSNAIFTNLLGKRTAIVLHGSAEKRMKLLQETDFDYAIINHDGVGVGAHTRNRFELDGFSKALAERSDIKIAIVDEASAYKDSRTKRHRIARLVFGAKPYLYLLTGTPTPQSPLDAFGLAKLVNNAFGKSRTSFQAESMFKVSNFKWVPLHDGYDKARALLTPSIRFDIGDVWLDAPEMTYQTREAELTAEQRKLMAQLKAQLQIEMRSGHTVSAVNEAAMRTKFLQLSLGAVYDENHKAHVVDASPRLAVLKEVLEQCAKKILLLCSFRSQLTLLAKALKEDYSVAAVHGDVTPNARAEIFRKFQNEDSPDIIIADPGVLAHGLNLQRGRTVIWYGPTDKCELFQQANARCYRPGQKFPVSVVQIVSNPLEKEIYSRLQRNASLQGALLDLIGKGEL